MKILISVILCLMLSRTVLAQSPDVLYENITAQSNKKDMKGNIAISVIYLESYGHNEDWTTQEKEKIQSELLKALGWWVDREWKAKLHFYIEYDTRYITLEPIEYPVIPYQDIWVKDALISNKPYIESVYLHNATIKDKYKADAAFTIFFVDASNDDNAMFADNFYIAYTIWVGGPYAVIAAPPGRIGYSGYGMEGIDSVIAHEIGHIFGAEDLPTDYHCIMSDLKYYDSKIVSSRTRRLIGWNPPWLVEYSTYNLPIVFK